MGATGKTFVLTGTLAHYSRDEAKAKIEASSSPSEVQELMKKSKEHLKLAHSTLKELVKEIKNLNEGQKVLKEVTAESLTA